MVRGGLAPRRGGKGRAASGDAGSNTPGERSGATTRRTIRSDAGPSSPSKAPPAKRRALDSSTVAGPEVPAAPPQGNQVAVRQEDPPRVEPLKVAYPRVVEIDNPVHRAILCDLGVLGERIDINRRFANFTYVEVNTVNMERRVQQLIHAEMSWRFRKERRQSIADSTALALEYSNLVASAFMRAVYSKLRTIHFSILERRARYQERPTFSKDIELPTPLASAVQYLGTIRPSDVENDAFIVPVHAEGVQNEGTQFVGWSLPMYQRAVADMQSYGLVFSKIDLNIKEGSSWWLYKPRVNEHRLELVMTLPPPNFTQASAVLAGIFLDAYGPVSDESVFTLPNDLAGRNFGTMLREVMVGNPNQYFNALMNSEQEFWLPFGC